MIDNLREAFLLKDDILDLITMMEETIEKFEIFKPRVDVVFGKASFIVKDLENSQKQEEESL